MKNLLTLLLFCLISLTAAAQPKFLWSKPIAKQITYSKNVMDKAGNTYSIGYCISTAEIGGIKLVPSPEGTSFLCKFTTLGKLVWVKTLDSVESKNLCIDNKGNIYVSGTSAPSVRIGNQYSSGNRKHGFLVKYRPDGQLAWSKFLFSEYNYYKPFIKTDLNGNCIVIGTYYRDSLDKADTPATNIFISKFDSSGIQLWKKSGYSGTFKAWIESVALDKIGNIYFCGGLSGILKFGKDSLHTDFIATAFILAKIDASGKEQWARLSENLFASFNATSYGTAVEVNNKGNSIYFAATFRDSVSFGGVNFKSKENGGAIIAGAYNSSGDLKWVIPADRGGTINSSKDRSYTTVSKIFLDESANTMYLAGTSDTLSFYFFNSKKFHGKGDGRNFLGALDLNGKFQWITFIKGYSYTPYYGFEPCMDSRNSMYYTSLIDTSQYLNLIKYGEGKDFSGILFKDNNKNGKFDIKEPGYKNKLIKVLPNDYYVSTDSGGRYSGLLDSGHYKINPVPIKYVTSCNPVNYSGNFTIGSSPDTTMDFGIQSVLANDVRIYAENQTRAVTGKPKYYSITCVNPGTLPESGEIVFIFDSSFKFKSSYPAASSKSGNTLHWNFSNLSPDDILQYHVEGTISTGVTHSDTLKYIAKVITQSKDTFPEDNTDTIISPIFASYDPNDITVAPWGDYIPEKTKKLAYTIRFQNTGNDTAYDIVLRDTLDSRFNLESFQVRSASHSYTLSIKNHVLEVRFANILLPHKGINEPASHGYFAYNIDLQPGLPRGTTFLNKAAIFFDYNEPVITNTARSTLSDIKNGIEKSTQPINTLQLYPNPFSDYCTLKLPEGTKNYAISLTDALGRTVFSQNHLNSPETRIPKGNLQSGIYILNVTDATGTITNRAKLMIK